MTRAIYVGDEELMGGVSDAWRTLLEKEGGGAEGGGAILPATPGVEGEGGLDPDRYVIFLTPHGEILPGAEANSAEAMVKMVTQVSLNSIVEQANGDSNKGIENSHARALLSEAVVVRADDDSDESYFAVVMARTAYNHPVLVLGKKMGEWRDFEDDDMVALCPTTQNVVEALVAYLDPQNVASEQDEDDG